jgi:L-asparaginase / beta-aspartyl-peptidase
MSDIRAAGLTASWGADAAGWGVLIHGGAGDAKGSRLARHIDGCRAAAAAAAEVLRSGGGALDAVERAVVLLEDDACFNAGTGACLNADGAIELDAAVMEGRRLRAGGVCALPPFLHPVSIARAVLDDGRHVLYAANGAEGFAIGKGFSRSTVEAMTTESARENWAAACDGRGDSSPPNEQAETHRDETDGPRGTVGAVARDRFGTVAAATSTGGRVGKRAGRVGDSPILGAGTYADDDGGACSATGDGEAVLRLCLAKSAIDSLRARVHPEEVARAMVRTMGERLGGKGGLILVDRFGRLGWARNTGSMTWAAAGQGLAELLSGA